MSFNAWYSNLQHGKTTGHSQMKTSAAQMIVRRAAGKYFFQVNFPSRHRASHVKTSEYMAPPHTVVAVFIRKARVKLRSRVMWIIPALRYPYAH